MENLSNELMPQKGIISEEPMCSISIAASMLNVHQRTLRIYDEEKILVPSRTGKNRRLYSFNDLEKGRLIQFLTRNLGINLSGVKIIMYILEKSEMPASEYIKHVSKIAENLNISPEIQQENRIKLSKRGRKPQDWGLAS